MIQTRLATTTDALAWDAFLAERRYRPFLQSWTMGDVYADIHQEPIRVIAEEGTTIVGVCLAILVPARRGRHLMVPYGPVTEDSAVIAPVMQAVCDEARKRACRFVRVSPFVPIAEGSPFIASLSRAGMKPIPSPLHLLAEHIWHLPLLTNDAWTQEGAATARTEDDLLAGMRKTTRNLVRRAEKDGVTVQASTDPVRDVASFIALHDETRKRHKFTPYTNAFFRAQVQRFAPRNECTVYLARYQGEVIAASIHMHAFGETSYHHGASDSTHHKVPASYLLQWTAIKDALGRGDRVYNFWGIAPATAENERSRHPFAGVTLFKTGFGGQLLDLQPCTDLPLTPTYRLTRAFESIRKWKRGF